MADSELTLFLQGLHVSKALEPDQLHQLSEHTGAGSADPQSLGEELLRRGWMTAYQIEQVRRGLAGRLAFGPYLLLECLGRGGMAEVYKARHRRLGRLAALKIIRPDRQRSPRRLARFRREMQTAARLDHPNVVRAYDAGFFGDSLFLAMEYLDGTDLKRLVRRDGPLPIDRACDCTRQAAEGLQHAFERRVVHRDVKPSNLLLTARGQVVKVLDLGMARIDEDEAGELTGPRSLLGTADYLAPEQILDPRAADVRSDLYGLGCTLYFLLTGGPPFPAGPAVQRMMAHLKEEARPVESLRPGLPPELSGLVRRLMAKRPEDRYPTPAEVAQRLGDLLRSGAASDCV